MSGWKSYFKDIGLQEELIESHMKYVNRMTKARLPVIFEFRHLAALLGRTPKYLASVVNSSVNHYRVFEIPKRRGGKRKISAPYPTLLCCQKWINKNILSRGRIHKASTGFKKRKNIKDNAEPHLGKICLLKMDLKDFFPSITLPRVINVFRRFGYPPNISFYLARLCCLEDCLPQGAATSPTLSNLIAIRLDKRLSALSKKWDIRYTRYADDLTFSGSSISIKYIDVVDRIVCEEGFKVNKEKTTLSRSKGKRVVTGLSVSGDKLKVPREFKRRLRQHVHFIAKYGYFSHTSKLKIRDPFYIDSIYGKLLFWKWIEPDNSFVNYAIEEISIIKNKFKIA